MPPRQRTFEIVPTTLTSTKGPVRPMTSKEAKKAHAKASRIPKLSRVEQRRLEAEERERQRNEYERERAAAKAKAARDKKAEKAAAERTARKKAGLPEPSKFVRPSQPSISVFVKTGTKRSWQEMDGEERDRGDASKAVSEDPEDERESPAKRIVGDDSEDEFGDFPSLSQSEIPLMFGNLDSSIIMAMDNDDSSSKAGSHAPGLQCPEDAPAPSQELPLLRKEDGEECQNFNSQLLAEMINTQLRSETVEAESRAATDAARRKLTPPPQISPIAHDDLMKATELQICIPSPRPGSRHSQTKKQTTRTFAQDLPAMPANLTSPRRPALKVIHGHVISQDHSSEHDKEVNRDLTIEQIYTAQHNNTVNAGRTISQNHTVSQKFTVHQAHTYDTAPPRISNGPTQRTPLREQSFNMMPPPRTLIRKATNDSTSARMQPSTRLGRSKLRTFTDLPPSSTQIFLDTHFDDFFPSPSQQLRELDNDIDNLPSNTQVARELLDDDIESLKADGENQEVLVTSQMLPRKDTSVIEAGTKASRMPKTDAEHELSFFCTQDLNFSSQDMAELDTPLQALSREKKVLTPAPPRRTRFFEEKEEDLVLAAIHESRIMAEQQKQGQKISLNDSFGTDCEDVVNSDKILRKAIPPNDSKTEKKSPGKRPFRRVSSSATDYGEDDLSGCSQEILAALDCAEHSANSSIHASC